LEKLVFNPFWDFIANNLYPDWLAPNMITLLGLIVPFISVAST
jgi:phosphatidylglycerophosphate synthase